MGTDIHGFVEQKIDDKWKLIAVETDCSWCGGTGFDKQNNQACYKCRKKKGKQVGYGDRCYLLFAILAKKARRFCGVKSFSFGDKTLPSGNEF